MGWAGAVALFLHLFFSTSEGVKKINSILKWPALIIGVIQAGTLAMLMVTGINAAPTDKVLLNFFFASINLTAWFLISSSEKKAKP